MGQQRSVLVPRGFGWVVRAALDEGLKMAERLSAESGDSKLFPCDDHEGAVTVTITEESSRL